MSRCVYHAKYDGDKQPLGPACGAVATQLIHWLDGQESPACNEHGHEALMPEGQALVSAIVKIEGAHPS